MSKTSPGSFPGPKYYDPDYTAQISCKMQIPDKISLGDRSGGEQHTVPPRNHDNAYMHVPERILVAGGDEHIAAREPLPELQMECALPDDTSNTGLTTPPRVLTLNQYAYPGIEVNPEIKKADKRVEVQSIGNGLTDPNESLIFRSPEDQIVMLSKQLRLLNQRVSSLEIQNQVCQQRDFMLYSAGILYFLFKGFLWIQRRF